MKNHTKILALIVFVVAVFTTSVMYFGIFRALPNRDIAQLKIDGTILTTPQTIHDFQLRDQNGQLFTLKNLQGHWSMMFFGFTNCGYVCPTTLTELSKMYKILQQTLPDNQLPQVIFVTVDPARDTQQRMQEYLNAFNHSFIGLSASDAETVAFANQLHITAVKMQAEDDAPDQYTINHSSEILLWNPEGKVQAYFHFPHKAEQFVQEYKSILKTLG